MPPLPAPGPIIRVEFKIGDGATVEAGSRFFISYAGGPPSSTNLTTFAGEVAVGWSETLAAVTNNAESLHGVICTDLASDVGAEGTWSGSESGSYGSGAQLIANAAMVVNHTIPRRYRGGRPRTYLRCGDETSLVSGSTNQWGTTFLGLAATAWGDFVSYVIGRTPGGFTPTAIVNVSWFNGNTVFTTPTGRARNIPVKRTTPLVDGITAHTLATKIGSQRRRLDI